MSRRWWATTCVLLLVAGTTAALSPRAAAQVHSTVRHFAATDDLHIQFEGRLVIPPTTRVFEIDGQGTSAATVRSLHSKGKLVVCYISAGSVESYRPDAAKFPAAVVGRVLDGWPDEKWLDVRQTKILLPIMRARIASCRAKGFDAMDFDNLDGYSNASGFPLTARDQLIYNRDLAQLAHAAGMQAVLKNSVDLLSGLVNYFDAALNEQCVQYSECGNYAAFVHRHKPVWVLEYNVAFAKACSAVKAFGLHVQLKHLSLDAWRRVCPQPLR